MSTRAHRQIRAIKAYAQKIHSDLDSAGLLWVVNGLAERWARQNQDLPSFLKEQAV